MNARKPAPHYRFNRKGAVILDDRGDGPKTSSPARAKYKAVRIASRADAREAARLNSPAAIAARIASAGVKS